jgi:F420-dependent hydroxymycolic acid dehydrogenase
VVVVAAQSILNDNRHFAAEAAKPNNKFVVRLFMSPTSNTGSRRAFLKAGSVVAGAAVGNISLSAEAQTASSVSKASLANLERGGLRKGMISYMLASEQFSERDLVQSGAQASRAGFNVLSTSDHFQPWQANEGHVGQAWVTMSALGAQTQSWMGTTVTCPTFRYNPAVVAEAFASLDRLYPGRVFLGVGSGEALNEQAATGSWPKWQERWNRLIEAITVIRQLWSGQDVSFKGKYYTVEAKLRNIPEAQIPLLTAANGPKSMRLAGIHGDGLVSDPTSWSKWKSHWEDGAKSAGKDPSTMPVLIEQYVVVGNQNAAQLPAELWRFGPKAWKGLFDTRDPAAIQQRADAEISIEEVLKSWAVGAEPNVHINKIRELFDSGATIVNIHCPQANQQQVIDFYGRNVLPKFV